jgi:hypothetical protein
MSAIKGRTKRQDSSRPTVALQARLRAEIRDEIYEAARLSGVSVAFYLDTFIEREVREHGHLPVYSDLTRPQQEELPIPAA